MTPLMGVVSKSTSEPEYKISFNGTSTYISWNTPTQDIHVAKVVMETNGYNENSNVEQLFHIQGQALPYMITGPATSAINNEVVTLYSNVGNPTSRTYTTTNIPSGIVEFAVNWNTNSYDFEIDGVSMSMFTEIEPVALQRWDQFGKREGRTNWFTGDIHSITLYGSNESTPIHQWLCNEGSGTILYDSIGSNNATLYDGTWVQI